MSFIPLESQICTYIPPKPPSSAVTHDTVEVISETRNSTLGPGQHPTGATIRTEQWLNGIKIMVQ